MACKLRIQYPGAIYHLMNRGDHREVIFCDDEDWTATVRSTQTEYMTLSLTDTFTDVHDFSAKGEDRAGKTAPIRIGQRARVCPETTIIKGVSLGDYAVVGNKSVVQGSLPARCVAVGNPARVVLQYKDPEPVPPKEKAPA